MTTRILLGVDVGTSDSKVLATTTDGREICSLATPTRWSSRSGSRTDTDPESLASSVFDLMDRTASAAADRVGPVVVAAVAFTGMAEAGVLTNADGQIQHPIIAWFDPRGGSQIAATPTDFRAAFPGRTGLPVSPLATISKLAWMRSEGTDLSGCQWLNVPEFLAFRLGGARAAERSLVSRTGLIDQSTGEPWPEALALLGASADLIPPIVQAGTPLGRVAGNRTPASLRGAVITVAGHDHPVAAVGSGSTRSGELFDSFGTAEALVLPMEAELDIDARTRLASAGVNAVHHVLPGRRLLLAGTKAGLLMRRTLELLGANDSAARDRLDAAACDLAERSGSAAGLSVSGADNSDGVLRITVDADGIGPAALWLAVIDHGLAAAAALLAVMSREVGPPTSAVVAGGWTRMRSVRTAKAASLPGARFSDRAQAGAYGATVFAAHALAVGETLREAGDLTANAVGDPSGPSEEFAAAYTAAPPLSGVHPDPDGAENPAVAAREHLEIHS